MIDKATVKEILPDIDKGKWDEVVLSKKCSSTHDARKLYQFLKLSFLDVGRWNKKKIGLSLKCALMDPNGIPIGRIARKGDRIKILPFRWQALFQDVNWFEIQRIEERSNQNSEVFFFTMVSIDDPLDDTEKYFTDHLLTVTIFFIYYSDKVDLQIHTVDYKTAIRTKATINHVRGLFNSFFIGAGFYKRQLSKLLKSLLNEGLAHLTNPN